MKKPVSIFLIALILFNTIGYYGVLIGLEYRHGEEVIKRLNSDKYDESESILINIPVTIPYANSSETFERVDGIFEHDGEFFRLVKKRLYNDTLQIICIRDAQHKNLNTALINHASSFSDVAKHLPTVKVVDVIKDYLTTSINLSVAASGWVSQTRGGDHPYVTLTSSPGSLNQPPEQI